MKYLLSTGEATDKKEKYCLDLFRIYLTIFPEDIPGNEDIGFDFRISQTTEATLESTIRFKIKQIIDKIKRQFPNLEMTLDRLQVFSKTYAKATITVNDSETVTFELNF